MRVWGDDPEIPNPAMVGAADRLEAEARRLAERYRTSEDPLVAHLYAALAAWSVVVCRWATSGPGYKASTLLGSNPSGLTSPPL